MFLRKPNTGMLVFHPRVKSLYLYELGGSKGDEKSLVRSELSLLKKKKKKKNTLTLGMSFRI